MDSTDNSSAPLPPQAQPEKMDEATVNLLINGLQQAASTKATAFPMRDVQLSTEPITNDPAQKVNYIPPPPKDLNESYIANHDNVRDRYTNSNESVSGGAADEDMFLSFFNKFHVSILLFLLFAIFQSPQVKGFVIQNIPKLTNGDMNLNSYGIVFMGIMFSGVYYILSNMIFPMIDKRYPKVR